MNESSVASYVRVWRNREGDGYEYEERPFDCAGLNQDRGRKRRFCIRIGKSMCMWMWMCMATNCEESYPCFYAPIPNEF